MKTDAVPGEIKLCGLKCFLPVKVELLSLLEALAAKVNVVFFFESVLQVTGLHFWDPQFLAALVRVLAQLLECVAHWPIRKAFNSVDAKGPWKCKVLRHKIVFLYLVFVEKGSLVFVDLDKNVLAFLRLSKRVFRSADSLVKDLLKTPVVVVVRPPTYFWHFLLPNEFLVVVVVPGLHSGYLIWVIYVFLDNLQTLVEFVHLNEVFNLVKR